MACPPRAGRLDDPATTGRGTANTAWTDGSRLDDKRVGAVSVWRKPEGWGGRRLHLGSNKEVFDTEVFAIYQALLWFEQRQGSGRRYTLFADSTGAIERVRSDHIGPGQRFVIVAIEVCGRILTRDNQVTIRWVPSHNKVEVNERADAYSKAAASRTAPCRDDATSDELINEVTLSYHHRGQDARLAKGLRTTFVPSAGAGPLREETYAASTSAARKELAGRFYQFLAGHGNIWSYLHRVGIIDDDTCWCCDTGER